MECTYEPLDQSFAVKRFEQIFGDDQRATRLLRELAILSKVDHCCLNRLVTVFPPKKNEEFKDAYLVIEKCDMDLKKLLKSNKYLEEVQCKSILYDILCGVNYLHKATICHRDLKPENILVNDDCTIQICDFGLSRSLDNIEDPNEDDTQLQHELQEETKENQTNTYSKYNRPTLQIAPGSKSTP